MLKDELPMIHETGGYSAARDDVIGMEMGSEGSLKAREVDRKFLFLNGYARCPRECAGNENGDMIDLQVG